MVLAALVFLPNCKGTHHSAKDKITSACADAQPKIDALPEPKALADVAASATALNAIIDKSLGDLASLGDSPQATTFVADLKKVRADAAAVGAASGSTATAAAVTAAQPALDKLDADATTYALTGCSSEAWGRRFFVVAGDLANA